MLTRLFVIVGGLLVLVLLAALVVPPFVDWTNYKADFEREASAILGRKVTVHGTAKARLLPFPSVTFSNVAVAGGPDGQPAMTVDTFSMDAELAPFLRGEVLIFDMRLLRPKALIDIAADGTVNWAVRPSSPFEPEQISIEKLTISDGEVILRHEAGGRDHVLSGIEAVVSAKSLVGPWRVDGSLRVDGVSTTLAAATGRADDAGRIGLRVRARPAAFPFTVELEGSAGLETGAFSYTGRLRIAGDPKEATELRGTSSGETVRTGVAESGPGFRLDGDFSLDHRKLAVEQFRFETGPLDAPYTADGMALIDLGKQPRFTIKATGAQVQFDQAVGQDGVSALTLSQRVAALEAALRSLPRPTIPGSVEVNLPAVVAGDTTIRDVKLSAEPVSDGWSVRSLSAVLPGRTTLEADGLVRLGDEFGFSGSLLLAIAQPSGFAAWLSNDVDEAVRRLPAAGFSARVELTDKRQTLSDLELILGKARFHGRIDAATPDNARPSVEMRLEGGELDAEGMMAFASLFVSDKGANRFADRDVDFQVKAGPVTVAGLMADRIDTAMRLRSGVLEIDRLAIGGLSGAEISATGSIRNFPDSPTGNIDASLVAVDLAPLVETTATLFPDNVVLRELAARTGAYPQLLQDARIDIIASAAENDDGTTGVAVSAQGNAGGSAFSASLSGQGSLQHAADARLSLSFMARNQDATALMALYGLPALPLGLVGEATTELSAKGTLSGGLATSFAIDGEGLNARFDGTVTGTPQGLSAEGKASLEAADIEPWLMTAGVAIPGMGMGTTVSIQAEADYGNTLLVLSGLEGTVNEAAVSGDLNASMREGQPHLSGSLALDELDLGKFAAMIYGDGAFAGNGKGWPKAAFSEKSVAPFSAEFDLAAGSLTAAMATAYDATLRLSLNRQGLQISELRAKMFGGDLTGLFELKNNEGTGLLSGQFALAGADITAVLPESGMAGTASISTTLSSSGKSVDAMISALSGSGTVALKDLSIANLDPEALPEIIAQADGIGRDVDAEQTAAFAPGLVATGKFSAADTDVAFTIAGGAVRVPPLILQNPSATVSADLAVDLAAGTVSGAGRIAYRPGEEELAGSEPAINFTLEGPIGAVQPVLDTDPLAQFLTQRALEKEQRRVEAMQAVLLEKQRLRREVRYYTSLQEERKRAEERRALEEMRVRAEEEARERARVAAELAAKARAEAERRAAEKAEAEAKARASAEREAAERARAEEAMRLAEEERARREAERKAAQPQPEVQRAPLPPPTDPPPKRVSPFFFEGLFGTQ